MGEIRTPCCMSTKSACICAMAFEALILAQSLVFTIGYISQGETVYDASLTFFSEIVSWEFLMPIVIVQVTLFLMNLISFLAIRCIVPYFLLPYIAMSVFSLFITTALIGVTIDRIVWVFGWSWPPSLLLLVLFLYLVVEPYFVSLKLSVFKLLVKRKKVITPCLEFIADCDGSQVVRFR
ncbi:hypothetical protein KIN20_016103 [Parelaphostrongylus tenuis]|uniref:Transmembrane protein n=1 Tax=Parelaphostrongylus tenuis TaxID=148309 RepID=A0AAD5MY56_PARTN|nr:hypothetical protein KIN20_016103 [Parelaphostrongylus tenuis]